MKRKLLLFAAGWLITISLTACGQNEEIAEFKNEIDDFCTQISEIDTSINNIDADSEGAITELLGYLDQLDTEFKDFAALDFPAEYDYLESLSGEAGTYMSKAVESFKEAYANGYNEAMGEYARENYSRAYKRIQIIITFLHGDDPENVNLSTESEDLSEE